MAYEDKPQSSGAIYPNNYKESGTKQPDFTGSIEISKPLLKEIVDKMKNGEVEEEGGVKVRVALWDNTSKKGNKYFYTRMDIPEQKREKPTPPVVEETPELSDDDIPF